MFPSIHAPSEGGAPGAIQHFYYYDDLVDMVCSCHEKIGAHQLAT